MRTIPPAALAIFEKNDPKILAYIKQIDFDQWFKPQPQSEQELFLRLCRIITGQQLSGKAAETIFNRFVALFDGQSVTPEMVLGTPDQKLRDCGLSWSKVRYVKDLAQKFVDKEIKFEDMYKLDDESVITELTKVKGIGRWSAEMFLMFVLHRIDVFAFDDLGLYKGIQKIYKLKNPTKKQIEKIIKKWGPYKTYGAIALWHSLEG
jgi:DNA-3-methyladenine glycosylase II